MNEPKQPTAMGIEARPKLFSLETQFELAQLWAKMNEISIKPGVAIIDEWTSIERIEQMERVEFPIDPAIYDMSDAD